MTFHIDQLPGGRADDMVPADFDLDDLVDGAAHELEHTHDPDIAMEIAMDHLAEDPEYYRKLETIHKADSLTKDELRKKNSTPEARAARRKYMASKKGQKANYKAQYAYRARHPERYKAQQKARTDGEAGKGHKCARCGKPAVHKHHTSYDSHDKYVWLCHAHHVKAHHPKSDLTKKSLAKSLGSEPMGPLVVDGSVVAATESGNVRTHLGSGRAGPLPPVVEMTLSEDEDRTERDRKQVLEENMSNRDELYDRIRAFNAADIVKSLAANVSVQDPLALRSGAEASLGVEKVLGSGAAPAGDGKFDAEPKSGLPKGPESAGAVQVLSEDDRAPEQQFDAGSESAIEKTAAAAPAPGLQQEVDKQLSKSGVAAGALGNDDDHKRRAQQIAALRKSQQDIMVKGGRGVPEPAPAAPAPSKIAVRGVTMYSTTEDEYIAKAMDENGCISSEPTLGMPGTLLTKSLGCASCGARVPAFLSVCPNCNHVHGSTISLRKSNSRVVMDKTVQARVRPVVTDDFYIP